MKEPDLRRPSLAKMFALDDGRPGLANLTAGTAKLDECVYRFEDGNIDILSCGQIPPNPLELLSSKHFATLISQLEKQYDRIVIDSPPIQAVSDALVLSQYAKAVVYVIEADSTHDDAVKNGIKRLQDNNAPIVGVILNKFDVEKASKYGYEYSGYYDHYGYSVSTQT